MSSSESERRLAQAAAHESDLRERLAQAEMRLLKAEMEMQVRILKANKRAAEFEMLAKDREATLDSIFSSPSWKVTRPLRAVKSFFSRRGR